MTIGNALTFIERGLEDSVLRGRLNSASSLSELNNVLSHEKLMFSSHDFDEAFNNRLTKCQETGEAEQLKEFKMWWDLLSRTFEPESSCGSQCTGCGA